MKNSATAPVNRVLFILLFISTLFCEERCSSYPYLSGDTWRFFCDWVLSEERGFDPKEVKKGDTIFVEYGRLKRFTRKYLPKIKAKFILITPNAETGSDAPLPGPFIQLAKSRKVAAWFLQNIDCAPSKKLIPLPIGLANQIWDHGDIQILSEALKSPSSHDEIFAYVNFAICTNEKKRKPCFDYFMKQPWSTLAPNRTYDQYLKDLSKSRFVISPPGNGLDCHRTWEALLMGAFPIVLTSTLDPLFEGLPVVVVQSWDEVTKEFLNGKAEELKDLKWEREKLFADYWFERVRQIQHKVKSEWFSFFIGPNKQE